MSRMERFAGLVGLLLLVAFFAPFVHKLTQLDITVILLGGVVLATLDFLTAK
jgi:hypothetical protein